MRLHKTGHVIADTVSDLVGDLPDGDYKAAYGILRHDLFGDEKWFEFDKGFWEASHYDGNYRLSCMGTQPRYDERGPHEAHEITLDPWRKINPADGYILVCPPTDHVCSFFGLSLEKWLLENTPLFHECVIRFKGDHSAIDWHRMAMMITFNSSLGFEALRRGIPVVSDPIHSTIGSFLSFHNYPVDGYDRDRLFSFAFAHQFKLGDKRKICDLINYYLGSLSGGTNGKQ